MKAKIKIIIINFLFLSLAITNANAQTIRSLINHYLKLIAQGKTSQVQANLSELIATYPDEPGVILLQGVMQDDASKAVKYYERILKTFPNSEWSEHAAWRLIQYYCIVGDTALANAELKKFRAKNTNSIFLASATDAVKVALSNAKYQNSENYKKEKNKSNTSVEETPKQETKIASQKVYYGLQVGIYSTLAAAESEKERFIKLKMRTEVREKLVQGEKKFAVIIGNYSSEQSALEAKKIVARQCNCNPLIYKK